MTSKDHFSSAAEVQLQNTLVLFSTQYFLHSTIEHLHAEWIKTAIFQSGERPPVPTRASKSSERALLVSLIGELVQNTYTTISAALYQQVKERFGKSYSLELINAIIVLSSWNKMNIALKKHNHMIFSAAEEAKFEPHKRYLYG
jgi:hypothetical protein